MNRTFLIAIIAWGALALAGCSRMASLSVIQAAPEVKYPLVHVLLSDAYDTVTVSSSGTYRIDGFKPNGDTLTYYAIAPTVIRRAQSGLMIIDRGYHILARNLSHVHITPHENHTYLRAEGKSYRGELHIRGNGDHKLAVINEVGMDSYLFGVVPGEIGFADPGMVHAIEAQAVAARTYAFSHLGQYGNKDYDLRSDVMDQVYGGVDAEKPLVTQAVWGTRGQVLRHNGGYVRAYYHSTCGGRTERIEDIWDREARSYLIGVDDDAFCSWSNYWDWTETCTRDWLDSNVAAFLVAQKLGSPKALGRLQSLRINGRLPSGRVSTLSLVFAHGTVTVRGDRSRWAFGRPSRNSAILPSADYELEFDSSGPDWTKVTVRGHGYGHGIGMCQCGAIGRARDGQNYAEILLHYYPGARLEKAY